MRALRLEDKSKRGIVKCWFLGDPVIYIIGGLGNYRYNYNDKNLSRFRAANTY